VIGSCRHLRHRGRIALLLLAMAAAEGSFAAHLLAQPVPANSPADVTQPLVLAPAEESAYSGTMLRRSRAPGEKDAASTDDTTAVAAAPDTGFGTARLIMSLGLVLAIIFVLKHFGQRWFVPGAVKGGSKTVETLSRSIIGPRQHVLLIRVGRRRVLVVADSGGKLSQLDQITDADEIAELTAQVRTDKLGPASTAFAGLFGKSAEKFENIGPDKREDKEDLVDPEMVDTSVAVTQSELQGLLEKVRGVSSRMGR
jgi:flagellar biogenesis protein FliO